MQTASEWLQQCELVNQDREDEPTMYYVTVGQAEARDRKKTRQALVDAANGLQRHKDNHSPNSHNDRVIIQECLDIIAKLDAEDGLEECENPFSVDGKHPLDAEAKDV